MDNNTNLSDIEQSFLEQVFSLSHKRSLKFLRFINIVFGIFGVLIVVVAIAAKSFKVIYAMLGLSLISYWPLAGIFWWQAKKSKKIETITKSKAEGVLKTWAGPKGSFGISVGSIKPNYFGSEGFIVGNKLVELLRPYQNQETVMYYATVNQKLLFPLSFTTGNTTVDVIKEAAGFYQV